MSDKRPSETIAGSGGRPGQDEATGCHDAGTYALTREAANRNRGAGWSVGLRRRGHKIVRLFKDIVYGSPDAAYAEARRYRDAVISALPPPTNIEQAVKLRKNNQSGISGVRRSETELGDVWQATLTTSEGHKRENFSISRFGEEGAKSMAIAQRTRWLKDLPVKHLAYAHHAEQVTRQAFAAQLASVPDASPQTLISDEEVLGRMAEINARFDAERPSRLRVRVKSYGKNRLSIAVSDGGSPAQRRLIQLNTASMQFGGAIAAAGRIREVIEIFYNRDVASWFESEHGNALLRPEDFNPLEGFNVTVCVPAQMVSRNGDSAGW